ncbi:MAG: hypothetical protein KKA54_20830 [Proteobacteria bacterium]|nr:hypothetical protein [Pseudomonadota bacterium]
MRVTLVTEAERTEAKQKAIRLKRSVLFDILKWSTHPEVDQAVDFFAEKIVEALGLKQVPRRKFKTHIKVVLLNLYAAYVTDSEMYVAYHHSARGYQVNHRYKYRGKTYTKKNRYNPLEIGWTNLQKVIDTLIRLNLVENHLGYADLDNFRYGKLSRMRANPDLIAILEESYKIVPSMIERAEEEELVELRGKKKKGENKGRKIKYEDTKRTKQMRGDLRHLNEILDKHCITLNVTDDEWYELNRQLAAEPEERRAPVDYSSKVLKRIFNDGSFTKGGRFYGGWWLQIPSDCRKHITFNTDFRGSHNRHSH